MKCFKKIITLFLTVSLCMSNSVVFAEMSDKQSILDYFLSKSESDRELTEIIVSFSNDINNTNIENVIEKTLNNTEIATKASKVANMEKVVSFNTEVEKVLSDNTVLIKTNNIDAALEILNSNEDIIYAQPNYRLYTASDETINNKLWAIENTGQIINGTQGSKNVDLNIPAAWEMTKGSENIVVAVLDTGIDITHTTLSDNIWINPNETNDSMDNDENGFIDDINGWDFVNNDSSLFDNADVDEHGTHMAGIIAANGQNGVCGVAPDVKFMPLKVMEDNSGYTSEIIEAINYAEENGAKIVNCSFSGLEYNPALEDAISKSNMLFVVSAGNYASNTDEIVSFPACYECENIF